MKTNREKPPVLGKFERRHVEETANHDVSVLRHNLAVEESEDCGYNPYDNPGPAPAPKEAEELTGQARVLRKIRKNR